MKTVNLVEFVNSYLATAAWVECDSDENTEFTKLAKETAKQDCKQFINAVVERFGEVKANELLTIEGNDLTYLAAHDFYLTRNGHGVGFWDKPEIYGEDESEVLTEISQKLGSSMAYHTRGKKSKLIFV